MDNKQKKDLEARANAILLEKEKEKENKVDLANNVNSFFDIAFGRTLSSRVEGDRSMFSMGSTKTPDKSLKDIFKTTCFGLCETYVGRFTNSDGSKIEILPEYTEQAIKYAELYQKRYGKEVKIDLI
jgi:hypothetical protein